MIDISVPLGADTPVWPGSEPVRLLRVADFESDGHAVTQLELGAHAGTHLDAPHHFLPEGATLDQVPLDVLVGPCLVVDVSESPGAARGAIGAEDLYQAGWRSRGGHARLLIRTRRQGYWDEARPFDPGFAGLDESAVEEILTAEVRLVGLDVPSVEPFESPGNPVHHRLMGAGVVLLETLRLSHVDPGEYELLCLPLALAGTEAAPARAVLRTRPPGPVAEAPRR